MVSELFLFFLPLLRVYFVIYFDWLKPDVWWLHMMRLEFALVIHLIGVFYICRVLNRINIRVLIVYLYMIVAAIAHLGRVTSSTYRSNVILSDPERPLWITAISVPFFCLEILFDCFHCSQSMSLLIRTCLKFLNDLALSTRVRHEFAIQTYAHRIQLRPLVITMMTNQISVPMLSNQTLTNLLNCWTWLWWEILHELAIQIVLNGLLDMWLSWIIVSIRWFVAVQGYVFSEAHLLELFRVHRSINTRHIILRNLRAWNTSVVRVTSLRLIRRWGIQVLHILNILITPHIDFSL